MPDIFTRQKRSDVMSRIRGTGNKATELRLIQIFRANGIISLRQAYGRQAGWRRGCALRIGYGVSLPGSGVRDLASGTLNPKHLKPRSKIRDPRPKTRATRSTGRVKPDFVFLKLRAAVFVDGCFWQARSTIAENPGTERVSA